jgi:hypothetical protein
VTLLCFGPDALHVSRFAVSPLAETLSEAIRLRQALDRRALGERVEAFGRWLSGDPFADGLLRLVTATKFLPDFVAIPPGAGQNADLADELAAMSMTRRPAPPSPRHSGTPGRATGSRGPTSPTSPAALPTCSRSAGPGSSNRTGHGAAPSWNATSTTAQA